MGFPGGSDGKESALNPGDLSSVPGLGRSLGEGNSYRPQCLAWRIPWTEKPGRLYSPWHRKESDMTEQLSLTLSQNNLIPGGRSGRESIHECRSH